MTVLSAIYDNLFLGAANASTVLADTEASETAENFLDSALGNIIVAICGAIGIIVALVGILKAIGAFAKGRVGEGFKYIVMTALLAAILFSVRAIPDMLATLGGWVESAMDSLDFWEN